MRAIQIAELTGPETALRVVDLPTPAPSHLMTPGSGVVVEVKAAGVSFPELLQTRGLYQFKPELPFVPGSEVAGTVLEVAGETELKPGDRVAAFCFLGGFAEQAVAPVHLTFPLPDALDFTQGAGLILNYHTAYFSLVTRGRLRAGETVLIHGAAGGVGTACIQVAKGLGATTIAVVSTNEKADVATAAGADHVLRSSDAWKDQASELSGGGVDMVLDPVGGDLFLDSVRCLARTGRVVVVGFAGGGIPELKVNRLLLRNTEVIGAGWGEYLFAHPEYGAQAHAAVTVLVESGHVRPIVGERHSLDDAAAALLAIEGRTAVGKVVLEP